MDNDDNNSNNDNNNEYLNAALGIYIQFVCYLHNLIEIDKTC